MIKHTNTNRPSHSLGLTLVEVLVALFILVTGILGAVAMQTTAKKASFDSMQRSMASSLAQDIIERMRSNNAENQFLDAYNGTYGETANAVPNPRCNSTASLCSAQEMVTNDLYEWELSIMGADVKDGSANTGGLLGARACILHVNNNITVVVSWQGREALKDEAAGGEDIETECGSAGTKRRQVVVNGFIY